MPDNSIVRKYDRSADESRLIQMIEEEGWDYAHESMSEKYKAALESSITYVAYQGDFLCGFSRSLDDCGIYFYVCDLLVRPACRGNDLGRQLMECLYKDFPGQVVYVMSDVDGYYEKMGYQRVGSVFKITDKINALP